MAPSKDEPGGDEPLARSVDAGASPGHSAKRREGRIERHVRVAREITNEPRSVGRLLREAFIRLWIARGGGLYGLGYLVTLVILEVQLFTGEVTESDGLVDFVTSQALEYVLRVGFMSFVNGILAFIWPVHVLQWLGGWGIAVLAGAFVAFDRVIQPFIEARVPELREARERSAQEKESAKAK